MSALHQRQAFERPAPPPEQTSAFSRFSPKADGRLSTMIGTLPTDPYNPKHIQE
jgi:hypothetical protein